MNESKVIELAKAMRNHAWLSRFRNANVSENNYNEMSDFACRDIAGYVDKLLDTILLDTILPEPVPVPVDWEKEIQTETGASARYIGPFPGTGSQCRIVAISDGATGEHIGVCNVFGADFRFAGEGPFGPHTKIINTPEPQPETVELGFRVSIARHPKHGIQPHYAFQYPNGTVVIDGSDDSFGLHYDAEESGWTFSPWQPCTVKG